MHAARVEPLELGERRNLRFERVERRALLLARMDQHRHPVPERHIGESLGRIVEERAAGERQRADEPVAERIMDHGRASARRVKADLLFGFEHGHPGVARQCRRGGRPAMPPPMTRMSALLTAQAAVSRSFTILPSLRQADGL